MQQLKDLKAIPISDKSDKSKIWWLYTDKIVSIYPVNNANRTGVASYMIQMETGQSYEIRDEADKSIIAELIAEYENDFNKHLELKKQQMQEKENLQKQKEGEQLSKPEVTEEGLSSEIDNTNEDDTKGEDE